MASVSIRPQLAFKAEAVALGKLLVEIEKTAHLRRKPKEKRPNLHPKVPAVVEAGVKVVVNTRDPA